MAGRGDIREDIQNVKASMSLKLICGEHVEVCHSRAPVGPATSSGLGRNQSAGQGRQTCPAKGKGSLAHREDPGKQQA